MDFGNYYEEEAGIQLFDIRNRIVKLQLQLIKAKQQDDRNLFKQIWNEVIRLRSKITPFTAKSGLLFTLANAFDNIENLGFSYIVREYEKQSLLTFMVEILNWVVDKIEYCYYHIDPEKHVYYDAVNDDFITSFNHQAIEQLEKFGWTVILKSHRRNIYHFCPILHIVG